MNSPRLNLSASNPAELLLQIARVDISVPNHTSGRTIRHRERYVTARLLATLAKTDELSFPLRVEQRDKPDFALHLPWRTVGIECVEAVEAEWAQIRRMRESDSPEAMVFLPKLKAGEKTLTFEERRAIARGEIVVAPWVGNEPECQWAETHAYCISQKTVKLRGGNYSDFKENWLLIQDGCSVLPLTKIERQKAAELCAARIQNSLQAPAFTRIFIISSSWLVRLFPSPVEIQPIPAIWS